MNVRKKNDSIESFSIEKFILSLERVSDEVDRPLTGCNLKRITKLVDSRIIGLKAEIIDSSEFLISLNNIMYI